MKKTKAMFSICLSDQSYHGEYKFNNNSTREKRNGTRKKPTLMQRLSLWLDQLPLRRRSSQRRSETPSKTSKKSKSVAPRLNFNFSSTQQCRLRDHSFDAMSHSLIESDQPHAIMPASWNRQETVPLVCRDTSTLNRQSFSRCSATTLNSSGRMGIRTNPWINRDRSSVRHNHDSLKPPNELQYLSIDRSTSFLIKSLDESTCSSGYSSQDSSPESSIHSPNWQPLNVYEPTRGKLEDKAVDCHSIDVDEALGLDIEDDDISSDFQPIGDSFEDDHVYHELEAFNRLSLILDDRACSSDSEFAAYTYSSNSSSPPSPVYATPFSRPKNDYDEVNSDMDYPNTRSGFTYISMNKSSSIPVFEVPSPPSVQSELDQVELNFLAELDAQIAELQVKSVAVRQLVDEARERRDVRARNNRLCFEQLSDLRQLNWVMRNHFELAI